MPNKLKVFLSHNSADKPAVEHIYFRLRDEVDLDPWLDKWNLTPGQPWQDELEQAIKEADACVIFIGRGDPQKGILGPWQHSEMRALISRQVTERGSRFPVIPVLLPGAERVSRNTLPTFLVANTWAEFRHSLDDPQAWQRLLCGIRRQRPTPPGGDPAATGECPYRGLEYFDVSHAHLFFGRESVTDWLVSDLRKTLRPQSDWPRFLAILGSSGSGKSSVARAGLYASLRQGALEESLGWQYIPPFRPGAKPLESLELAVVGAAAGHPALLAVREELSDLLSRPEALHRAARLLTADLAPPGRVLFLVDQFEEIFTQAKSEEHRKVFVEALLHAASEPEGPSIIVLTMRADFYPRLAAYEELARVITGQQFLLSPMSDTDLRRATEEPARRAGAEFREGLVDTLVEHARRQPGSLPLLEFVLRELWQNREDGRWLTPEAYRRIGGIEGALQKRAEEVFTGLSVDQQELCRRLFLRLANLGESGEDTRRRVRYGEVAALNPDTMPALLRRLTAPDSRLVVTAAAGKTEEDEASVEVAHEALIRSWPRLRAWLDADREGLKLHRRITETAQEWDSKHRAGEFLWTGGRLAAASEWARSHYPELAPLEREFLEASREESSRIERLAEEALRRRQQEALRLVSEAHRRLYSTPERALLLAAEAIDLDPTAQAEAAQSAALEVIQRRREVAEEDARDWGLGVAWIAPTFFEGKISAQLSRDGRYVVLATERDTNDAYLLDYQTLKLTRLDPPRRRDPVKRRLEYLGFSQTGRKIYLSRQFNLEIYSIDGVFEREFYLNSTKYPINLVDAIDDDRVIIAADTTGSVFAVDPVTEKPLGTLTWWTREPLIQFALAPSGRWAAMLHKGGAVFLWPVASGTDPSRWSQSNPKSEELPARGTISIAFSPSRDEDLLLVAGREGFVSLWQLSAGGLVRRYDLPHGMPVDHASFSDDGARILTVADDRLGRIWEAKSGTLLKTLGDPAEVDWPALRRVEPAPLDWPTPTALPVSAAIPVANLPPGERMTIAGQVWHWPAAGFLESRTAYRILNDQAVPFPQSPGAVRLIEFGGYAWLLQGALFTPGPVHRVAVDSYISLAPFAERVSEVVVAGDCLWMLTNNGAYRVSGDRIERIIPEGVTVHSLTEIDGQKWFSTSAGAYRLESGAAARISDRISVLRVAKVGDKVWIFSGSRDTFSTELGPVYWVDGYRAVAIAHDYQKATFVEFAQGTYWIGADDGIYGLDQAGSFWVKGLKEKIIGRQSYRGYLWVYSDKNVYRLSGRQAKAVSSLDPQVMLNRLEVVGGRLWLFTKSLGPDGSNAHQAGPVFVVDGDSLNAAPTGSLAIQAVQEIGNDIWFLSEAGPAFRLSAETLQAFPREGVRVYAVLALGGAVWLQASDGAYRVTRDQASRIPNKNLGVTKIEEREGVVHVVATEGVYRVEADSAEAAPLPNG